MARFLPLLLPRTSGDWCPAHPATRFPSERPRFLHGDPRDHAPQACALLAEHGDALLPWGNDDGDLLFAPAPRPGEEAELLREVLTGLPGNFPVLLYPRESPLLPNLDCQGEELCMLPAERMALLLRGTGWAERRPGPHSSLQNRVYLGLALDLWRSLMLLSGEAEHSRLLGEVRLDAELDLLAAARGQEFLPLVHAKRGERAKQATAILHGEAPPRVHLPWWAGRSWQDWFINQQCAKHWPTAWSEVEIQVQVGTRFRRLPARRYFKAMRMSGSLRRLIRGR